MAELKSLTIMKPIKKLPEKKFEKAKELVKNVAERNTPKTPVPLPVKPAPSTPSIGKDMRDAIRKLPSLSREIPNQAPMTRQIPNQVPQREMLSPVSPRTGVGIYKSIKK